jgi:hypothetical protein
MVFDLVVLAFVPVVLALCFGPACVAWLRRKCPVCGSRKFAMVSILLVHRDAQIFRCLCGAQLIASALDRPRTLRPDEVAIFGTGPPQDPPPARVHRRG